MRGFARAGKQYDLNTGTDTRMRRHSYGARTFLQFSACECNFVSCTDSPSVWNRRMLSSNRAVLSACGRTIAGTLRTPHSFSLHFPFLGTSQPLHIPAQDTDCLALARCRPGAWESPNGVSKWRCDAVVRGSIHEPIAWLVDGVGSVGGVLLVPTSSLVRMTVGSSAVSY